MVETIYSDNPINPETHYMSKNQYYTLIDNMLKFNDYSEEDKGQAYPENDLVSSVEKALLIYELLYQINTNPWIRDYDMNTWSEARTQWDLVNMLRDIDNESRVKMVTNYLEHFSPEVRDEIWGYVNVKQLWNRYGLTRIKDVINASGVDVVTIPYGIDDVYYR